MPDSQSATPEDHAWPAAGSETARLVHSFTWDDTTLGAGSAWSTALQNAVRLILAHPLPMVLWWGPDGCQIYNDAFARLIGRFHPEAFGQTTEFWRERWPALYSALSHRSSDAFHAEGLSLPPPGDEDQAGTDLILVCGAVPVSAEEDNAGGVLGTFLRSRSSATAEPPAQKRSAVVGWSAISEDRCRIITASAGLGIYSRNLLTGEDHWSDEVKAIYGLRPEDPLPLRDGIPEAIHPDDRQDLLHELSDRLQRTRQPVFSHEHRILLPSGEVRWVLLRGRVVFDEHDRPVETYGFLLDITDRRRAEEKWRRYELLAANARDILLFVRCADGRITEANAAAEQAYGYSREELLQMRIHDLRDPDTAQATNGQMCAADHQGIMFQTSHRRRDGSIFPVEVSSQGAVIEGTRTLVSVIRDISERKATEKRLRESEARFRSVFEQAAIGMGRVRFDDARWIDVNDAFCHMLGYSREEMQTTPWPEMTHPDDIDLDLVPFREMAAGDLESYSVEKRFSHKRGHLVWARLTLSLVRDASGRPDYEIAIIEDITGRKQAEEALRLNEQRLQYHIGNSPLAVIEWDSNSTILRWEGDAERMFGWSAEEVVGRKIQDLSHIHEEDADAVQDAMHRLLSGVETRNSTENRNYRKDGSVVRCEWHNSALLDANGKLISVLSQAMDVTARRRAEQELRESEGSFRRLANAMPQLVWTARADGTVDYYNDRYREYAGIAPNGEAFDWAPTLHEDDVEPTVKAWRQAVETGTVYQIEHRVRKADGSYRWHLSRGFPVRDDQGEVIKWYGTATDIHETRKIQDELRQAMAEAEERGRTLNAMMDSIPMGITIADAPDVHIRQVSRFGRELTGRLAENLENIPADLHPEYWQVYTPDGRLAKPEDLPLTRATVQGEQVREEEWVLHRPDGQSIPILCTAAPIRDADGRITGGVVGWLDISERKMIENSLRESEARFRTLADNMSQLAWMTDETGWVFWYNKRWFDYTGTALREMQGWGWTKVLHPDHLERVVEKIRLCFSNGTLWEDTYLLRRRDGEYRWFLSRAIPIQDEQGKIVRWFGTNTDITEQRHAEEELRDADRRKTEFLAVLSHELRNPLAPIKSSLYIIDRAAPGGDQARRALAIASRQVDQLVRLVDDLLDVTRITRNKITLQRETLELSDLVRRTTEDYRSTFEKARIQLTFHSGPSALPVYADWNRLAQVVGNLLQNAVKFTPPEGQVDVELTRRDGTAVLTITDNGVGMEPETVARLFEPFMQAERSLDRSKGGLGLGLALVKGLVELHGGAVGAESDGLGTGSRFFVELPLLPQEVAPQPAETEQQERKRLRVLIIEDNIDAAESLREMLEMEGQQVVVAYNGPSGLLKAHEFRPDLVICDIGLPGMDGFDVARSFRAQDDLRNVTLVALSGYALPEDQQRAREAGFDRHLRKPADLEDLEQLLR